MLRTHYVRGMYVNHTVSTRRETSKTNVEVFQSMNEMENKLPCLKLVYIIISGKLFHEQYGIYDSA